MESEDGKSSGWIVIDYRNPADSDSDDRGVLSLPASCCGSDSDDDDGDGDRGLLVLPSPCRSASPCCSASDDDDEDDRRLLVLPSSCAASAFDDDDEPLTSMDDNDEEDDGDEYLYEAEEEDDTPRAPPPGPLSGMFIRHASSGDAPAYAAFDAVRGGKQLIPDPAFSAVPEKVTVLASTRGLVLLLGAKTELYYVANPVTFTRVRLPYQNRDHRARVGEPAFVVTFDEPRPGDAMDHYHVVVAFQIDDGVCAFESFSSRTWEWRVGAEICAVETVVPESGVGALGHAFWRTTIGYILCYNPETGRADLIPAPQQVETQKLWEIGEMEGNFCAVCMDEGVSEVVVLYFVPHHLAGEPSWTWAGQFDVGRKRNSEGARLLRSQSAAEVVMLCPQEELVLAMDFDGRVTRTIGSLSSYDYSDFVPYVSSSTDIYSDQAGAVLKTNDGVTFLIPNSSLPQAH